MSHVLSLYDGSTTVPLSTTNVMLLNYTPSAPEAVESSTGFGAAEGEFVGDVFYRNITETAELYIYAASKTLLQTATRAIEQMLDKAARRRALKRGTRVWLLLTVDGEGVAWRSEILAGRLELAPDALALWPNVAYEARLMVTRRPYWEGAEAELHLSSNATAETTGGVVITNTVNQNWVQIAANRIGGSLPAAVRLDVANPNASQQGIHTLFAIANGYADTAVDMYMTGAEAIGGSGSVTGAGAVRWMLADGLPDACKGGYVRVLVYFTSYTSTARLRGGIETNVTGIDPQVVWGPYVDLDANSEIADVGMFAMLPGQELTGYGDGIFRLDTTASINVHHVEFVPVSCERRLVIVATSYSLDQNEAVVDDGIEGETYTQLSNGDKRVLIIARGGPLLINPGVAHRIVLAWRRGTTVAQTSYTGYVRMWYRPRRATI